MKNIKILQIIPAPAGMHTVHEGDNCKMYEQPVVALALVEADGWHNVVPMSMDSFGEICIATDESNFCMVLFDGEHLRREESGQ